MNDITLAIQIAAKIFSNFFIDGPNLFIVGLFALAGIAFWAKSKLES